MIVAALLNLLGAGTFLLGFAATLVSCSPGTDMGDAKLFVGVGPPAMLAGLFGVSLARRIWRRRRGLAPTKRTEAFPLLTLTLWLGAFAVISAVTTHMLVAAPPWIAGPVVFYGPYYVVEVVPLLVFLRFFVGLCGLRLLPVLARFLLLYDKAVAHLAIGSAVAALLFGALAYQDLSGASHPPHGLALAFLDVALSLTSGIAAVDFVDAAVGIRERHA